MTTLFDVIFGAAMKAGQVDLRVCTSAGTTGTAVCSDLTADYSANTDLVGAPLYIVRTTDGLAPIGEAERITSYTASTGTVTVTTLLTVATGSGDTIGIGKPGFPWLTLVELANQVLTDLGTVDLIDTSLTTASNQTEYALPVALKLIPPKKIEVQGITTDANDNRYWTLNEWEVKPAAAGSTGLLVIPQLTSGRTIKITYNALHPAVTTATGRINDNVHPTLLKEKMIEAMFRWKNTKSPSNDSAFLNMLNGVEQHAENAKREYSPKRVPRKNKGFPWGDEVAPRDDDPNTIRW